MTTTRLRGVLVPLTLLAAPLLMLGCGGSATAPAAATQTVNPVPAVVLSGTTSTPAAGPVTITFTFSEPVSAFPASDVTVTGGAAAATTTMLSAHQYTLVVTPPANASGSMTITIAAGAFTDAAGVANTVAASVTQTYDTVVVVNPTTLDVFTDDYAANVGYAPFGGSTGAPVVDTAQAHSGTASLRFDVPATNYVGGALVSSVPVDLSSYNALTFWVKASQTATLDVAGFGNDANGNVTLSAESTGVPVTTSWQQYVIPLPVPSKATASTGLAHFAKGATGTTFSIWVDDIQYAQLGAGQVGAPTSAAIAWPAIPTLAIGGTFPLPVSANTVGYAVPALASGQLTNVGSGWFTFTTTPTGVATVDATGTVKGVSAGSTSLTASLGSLAVAGSDAITVVSSISAPASGAPAPTLPSGAIVLLDSSNPTQVNFTVGAWDPYWNQASSITPYAAGSATIELLDLIDYQGINLSGPNGAPTDTQPAPLDISSSPTLHISYWTPDGSTFTLVPIDDSDTQENNGIASGTLTQNGWTDLELVLPNPTAPAGPLFNPKKLCQLKFVVGTAAEHIYLDNIYFH